jgi:hypothetical protein
MVIVLGHILYDNYRLPLPVSWVISVALSTNHTRGRVAEGLENQQLSDKIMALYKCINMNLEGVRSSSPVRTAIQCIEPRGYRIP